MPVLAKFVVNRSESTLHTKKKAGSDTEYERVEMRTIVLSPVYSDKPDSENRKFWDASPTGEIKLGTVNPEAWQQFELGKEYYVEFRAAE